MVNFANLSWLSYSPKYLKLEGPEALNRSPDYTGQKSNI